LFILEKKYEEVLPIQYVIHIRTFNINHNTIHYDIIVPITDTKHDNLRHRYILLVKYQSTRPRFQSLIIVRLDLEY